MASRGEARQAAHDEPARVLAQALLPLRRARGAAPRRSRGRPRVAEAAALAPQVALRGGGLGAAGSAPRIDRVVPARPRPAGDPPHKRPAPLVPPGPTNPPPQ